MDFRDEMHQASKLRKCGIPVMFLTATLPPRILSAFIQHCKIPAEFNGLRGPTDRKEHCYTVFKIDEENIIFKTAAFVSSATDKIFKEAIQRGIIYVRTIEDGKSLQNKVPGVDFIYGRINNSAREKMIKKWKEGQTTGWIIGTSALIQGVDYPNVHLV